MSANRKSLWKGIGIIIGLCALWLIIAHKNFTLLAGGIVVIVFAVGIAGYRTLNIQHLGVPTFFGKRQIDEEDEDKQLKEGPTWRPPGGSIEEMSAKNKMIDIPTFIVKSSNAVPMKINIAIYYEVINAAARLNVEEVDRRLAKRAKEAARAFVISHTDKECEGAEKDIQDQIEEMIDDRTKKKCGVNVTATDVEEVEPVDEILKGYAEIKNKKLHTETFVENMKKIKKGAPQVSDDTLVTTTQVVEGTVKKTSEEKKTTLKLDLETGVLKDVAKALKTFLSKEDYSEGDEK